MIIYEKLWKTMKERNMTQYKLIKDHHVSAGQLSRLRAGDHISTHTLDILCHILDCRVEDIITYIPDHK